MVVKLTLLLFVFTFVAVAQESNETKWTDAQVREVKELAFRHLRANNWTQAETTLASLPKNIRNDPFVAYALGLSQFNQGKIDPAAESLGSAIKALRASKNNQRLLTESLVLGAIIASRQNRNQVAVSFLQEARGIAPENFDVNFGLARALFGNADYKGAELYFKKSVELRPNDLRARFFYATALEKLGENEKALAVYRAMLKSNPENMNANLGLGVLLSKIEGENSTEATTALEKVVSRNPDHYEAQVTLGKNLVKQEKFLQAIVHLEKAASLKPENPEPQYQLVIAYRRAGKLKESRLAAEKVKEIHKNRRGSGKQ